MQERYRWLWSIAGAAVSLAVAAVSVDFGPQAVHAIYSSPESSLAIGTAGIALATAAAAASAWKAARDSADIDTRVSTAQNQLDRSFNEVRGEATSQAGSAAPLTDASDRLVTTPRLISELAAEARVQPAWNVARGTLEKYWNRNLNQNAFIFWLSIAISALGFSVTLWAVSNALSEHASMKGNLLAAVSGAVTQIIGATFLVIYRSTAQQGLEYNRTLERINSVAMAWYILQSMSEASAKERVAKDAAKAILATAVATAGGSPAVAASGGYSKAQAADA